MGFRNMQEKFENFDESLEAKLRSKLNEINQAIFLFHSISHFMLEISTKSGFSGVSLSFWLLFGYQNI